MALNLKLQREIEADIHDQLYSNIFILTLKYPTTKEFDACFKKDMFIKNNKTAYLHVVHFLLNILDPTFFKQKNIWPILDPRMETQFRNELMKYINEINSTNKETGIPLLMTSHLITPGGYRFADFIFRLSQFVLCDHVKRVSPDSVIPFVPKAHNNYNISSNQVKNMEGIIDNQYNNLVKQQQKFESKLNEAKDRIEHIRSQQPSVEQVTKEIEEKMDGYFNSNESQLEFAFETLPQRQELIDSKLIKLNIDSALFQKCCTLIEILNENKNTVNCTVEINNSSHSDHSKAKNHVDLIKYFQSLLESLKNNKFVIKNRKDPNLPEYATTSSEIVNELNNHYNKYEDLVTELELCISCLENPNISVINSKLHKYEKLSDIVRNLFESNPLVNFSNV